MEYIALVMVAIMWAYFLYICNLLFRGILNNSDKNYKEYLVKMIVIALLSYGVLALAVNIIRPSVFLKPLLIVGSIISFERIIIIVALIAIVIRYIRNRYLNE